MNSQLIADAVRGDKGDAEATIWDRLYAYWHRRLAYTQIWEDPVADLAALRLAVGSTIVTISSGGCNALSYLMAQPAQVYAVDLNEAHLALLKLKLAGLRTFSDYSDFWQFFGAANSPANSALYRERLRPLLDAQARGYWDRRNIVGRPRHAHFTDGFYRHGMLGRFIGLAHVAAKFSGIDPAVLLNGRADEPARIDALERLDRACHSWAARLITATPALLFSLGIPPRQRALLGDDAPLNDVLHKRLLRLIDGHPNETNYFAWQALNRGYAGPGDRCLPPFLQRRQYERMRGRRLDHSATRQSGAISEWASGTRSRCRHSPGLAGWMATGEIRKLWTAIDRAGTDNVHVIFRTAGEGSPIESEELASLRRTWRRDDERSAVGFAVDRSGIYGGFHCYGRR